VKFEDALGRIIPVPSEYDWDVSGQNLLGYFCVANRLLTLLRNSRQLSKHNSKLDQVMQKLDRENMNSSMDLMKSALSKLQIFVWCRDEHNDGLHCRAVC
jgi:hypothetical protein